MERMHLFLQLRVVVFFSKEIIGNRNGQSIFQTAVASSGTSEEIIYGHTHERNNPLWMLLLQPLMDLKRKAP